jgi:exonuclease VII large subunit
VLDRGFALVRRYDGGIARRAADLPAEGAAFIRFADGERRVELGKSAPARGPSARGRKQGDLFE